MTAHKRRTGEVIVCYKCKSSLHDECANDDDLFSEVIVCHCKCQPACDRGGCVRTIRQPQKRAWKHDDPRWGNN